ncbi:MAG: hypothetical protein RL701_3963 [Pseudomonadota bacterium]
MKKVFDKTPINCALGLWLAAIGCGDGTNPQQGVNGITPPPTSAAPATGPSGTTATGGVPANNSSGRGTGNVAGTSANSAGASVGVAGMSSAGAVASAGSAAAVAGTPAAGSGAGSAGLAATGGAGAAAAGTSASAGSSGAAPTGMVLDPKQTLIPHKSWDCGMPEGMPGTTGALVFDADMQVGEIRDIGETQYGHRHQIDIKGGSVIGSKLKADILDRGLDYQLVLSNGAVEVEQINILRASDGALIYVRTCGTAPSAAGDVRIAMDFEAPNQSAYAFLNTGKFVGTREFDPAKKTLKIHVFEAGTPELTNAVQVQNPDGVPDQTWDCKVAMGAKGDVVYTESVGIGGGSLSVGESKRGNRNIIPITGGTTTGRIPGKVLSGGADFQIIANGTFHDLDARYSLLTNENEVIIVRNCGPIGALVPVFEASKTGKYAWLNANTWLSSDPGLSLGAVNLTIYETR